VPALLQIPIFFALFSLFNSDLALRGADFLWSTDLSAFDVQINLGFRMPFFGSHISTFNLTACATSFLISWYSMSMTPDQSNPVLKYMPYIFPIFLLFFFNQLPSALTWYYTVSNVVTLILQFIIQHYIIDHDKIIAKIDNEIVLKSEVELGYIQMLANGQQDQQGLGKCQILESLLINKLLVAKAEIDSVVVEKATVDEQLDRRMQYFIEQIGSEKKLEEYYGKTINSLKDELRKQVKEQMLVQKMQDNITSKVKVR
jgi:hypothetical protein